MIPHSTAHYLRELERLSTEDVRYLLPMGNEVEGFVFSKESKPVDLSKKKNFFDQIKKVAGVYDVGTDLGRNMAEVAMVKVSTSQQYVEWMRQFFEALPSEYLYQFSGTCHNTLPGFVDKNRYHALIDAIEESGSTPREKAFRREKVIKTMTTNAGLQINLGVESIGGIFNEDSLKLMYAFNNWGVPLANYWKHVAGDDSSRIATAWTDFAEPERLPRPLSWEFFCNLEGWMKDMPQLIIEFKDKWHPWGRKPDSLKDNPAHSGTIWPDVRPQGIGILSDERIELRSFNSMCPRYHLVLMEMIDDLVTYVLHEKVEKLPMLSDENWWALRHSSDIHKSMNFLNQIQKGSFMKKYNFRNMHNA